MCLIPLPKKSVNQNPEPTNRFPILIPSVLLHLACPFDIFIQHIHASLGLDALILIAKGPLPQATHINIYCLSAEKHCYSHYALIYLVVRPAPIRFTEPVLTIAPRTASTVVGLTSGRVLQISALDSGVRLFRTVASTRAFFVIFLPCTTANRLSSSL